MPCKWCNSTGGECGCGEGHCTHCGGSGHVFPPPFGDGSSVQNIEDATSIAIGVYGSAEMIQAVAQSVEVQLPKEDVQKFMDYWDQPYRDCTVGDYIYQIIERAQSLK